VTCGWPGRARGSTPRFPALRLHPGGGHAWMLARAVGPQQAMLACLFGEVWDARAALAAGLVAAVIEPPAELLAAATGLGERLAGQEKEYVRRLTATLRAALTTPSHAEALAAETEAQRWSATRAAFADGVTEMENRIARRG
jgi:enoyl-CoA hydratase